MRVGDKVKYTKPDAYPGLKAPTEIKVGEVYTIEGMRERESGHKRQGECEISVKEVPDSWYGYKRFEKVADSAASRPTVHKGINI